MQTKLISVTSAVGPYTNEELIVYIARVSNPANRDAPADKLIRYLIDNKHWSPFEMVDLTFEIITSRAIAQQILRHRSFSFQEFSQRYAVVSEMEPVQLRKQAEKNRQSSTEAFDPKISIDTGNDYVDETASEAIEAHLSYCESLYKALIEAGVAKECARMVLPLTTQTTLYMKGSVRSWLHYFAIRCDSHTQLEHQQIALSIRGEFSNLFPVIAKTLFI